MCICMCTCTCVCLHNQQSRERGVGGQHLLNKTKQDPLKVKDMYTIKYACVCVCSISHSDHHHHFCLLLLLAQQQQQQHTRASNIYCSRSLTSVLPPSPCLLLAISLAHTSLNWTLSKFLCSLVVVNALPGEWGSFCSAVCVCVTERERTRWDKF